MKPLLVSVLVALSLFEASAVEPTWLTDFSAAQEQARTEKKLVLIDFTGSDWCGYCIKLKKEVFSTPEFVEYAKKNLVLLEADFPTTKKLPAAQVKANDALRRKYDVEGYPTLVILSPDGSKLGQQGGYDGSGPKKFIEMLERYRKT